MHKALFMPLLVLLTSACVPTSYEPLQAQQSELDVYWQKNISQDITQYSCIVCHHSESIANESDYVLLQNNESNYLEKNLETTVAYIQSSDAHGALLLSKARGVDHTSVLVESSDKYKSLQSFVNMASTQDQKRNAAVSYYKDNLSTQLVQSQCTLCHAKNRIAKHTSLLFVDSDVANYQDINANRTIDFASLSSNNSDNVFLKATGVAHGGGMIIESDSVIAGELSEFLNILTSQGQ